MRQSCKEPVFQSMSSAGENKSGSRSRRGWGGGLHYAGPLIWAVDCSDKKKYSSGYFNDQKSKERHENELSYLYVLVLSSQKPQISDPTIPAMTMVKPILPAFTSSPWGKQSLTFRVLHTTWGTFKFFATGSYLGLKSWGQKSLRPRPPLSVSGSCHWLRLSVSK